MADENAFGAPADTAASMIDSDHARSYLRAAEALIDEGDASGAVDMLLLAIDTGSTTPASVLRIAAAVERTGQVDRALDALAAAVMRAPADVELLDGLGSSLLRAGRPDEAARMFTSAASAFAAGLGEMLLDREKERIGDLLGKVGTALAAGNHLAEAIDVLLEARSFHATNPAIIHRLSSALLSQGRFEDAERVCRDAMALGASSAAILLNLASASTRLGKLKEAAVAFDHAALLSPGNKALEHLAGAARGEKSPAAPLEYTRDLYDRLAADYDNFALYGLQSRGPGMIARLVGRLYPDQIGDCLDLGCGSGLVGTMIQGKPQTLVGVDISPAMLDAARRKGIYTDLVEAGFHAFLSTDPRSFDLVIAADSLGATGKVQELFGLVAARMRPGGHFVLAVEAASAGTDWALLTEGRYAHGRAYLERCLADAGFSVTEVLEEPLRRDRDATVDGLFLVARRSA